MILIKHNFVTSDKEVHLVKKEIILRSNIILHLLSALLGACFALRDAISLEPRNNLLIVSSY